MAEFVGDELDPMKSTNNHWREFRLSVDGLSWKLVFQGKQVTLYEHRNNHKATGRQARVLMDWFMESREIVRKELGP